MNVKLYNTVGILVHEANLVSNSSALEVDIRDLPKGLYIVNIQSGNNIVSRKIILNK